MHDLLTGLLLFEPSRRLTVDECLTSPLFANMGPSPSTEYPPTSPSFEFSFERSKATKLQLKALIVQEANEIHREHLAKKTQRNNANGNNDTNSISNSTSNSSKVSNNESQAKKRSSSTGRSIPSTTSSNLNGRNNNNNNNNNTRGISSNKPISSNQHDIHDDEDNASKHSYRSEVTSSTHGTHNRSSSRTRTTMNNDSTSNGISYSQPKEKEKERGRAQSTGRVQVASGIQPTYPSEEKYESSPRRYSDAPTSRSLKQESKKISKNEEKDNDNYNLYGSSKIQQNIYHQVQSPSRKNKVAMTELDNEEYSKKAMSYLSQNHIPTYPKSPPSEEDENNNNGDNADNEDDDDDNHNYLLNKNKSAINSNNNPTNNTKCYNNYIKRRHSNEDDNDDEVYQVEVQDANQDVI
mmetsp:Transcript_15054/g.15800  ORF Transcript_15054/g.15800 Transcript_15054/m.15800 type:complete len:409 (-) Transcript_15054:854-2080(-)